MNIVTKIALSGLAVFSVVAVWAIILYMPTSKEDKHRKHLVTIFSVCYVAAPIFVVLLALSLIW